MGEVPQVPDVPQMMHLHRYCNEFAFRWDFRKVNDGARLVEAIVRSEGKRLTYREPSDASAEALV